jgi:hypothetical protein
MKITQLVKHCLLVLLGIGAVSVYPALAVESKTILVYGASGRIGQVIVDVALERGHRVIGVSRDPDRLAVVHEHFTAVKGDLTDADAISELAGGADAMVISISARAEDNLPEHSLLVSATKNVQAALARLEKKPYILQIGGANLMYGTTYEEVRRNMTNPAFAFDPGTSMYGVLFGHQLSLDMYRASALDWSVLAPPMRILGIYGELDKTSSRGSYRSSTSGPLVAEDGSKTIYVRDLAVAAVQEIEDPKFRRQVFTVAY